MPIWRATRVVIFVIVVILITIALRWVWRTDVKPERVSLFIAAVIGAVTTIYALVTYEILLENRTMAKAASESTTLMERSLRFSHSPNLLYQTVNTKDPTFKAAAGAIVPVDNSDYRRALAEFNGSGEQKEFVFAVISNKGQGAATNLNVEAVYKITDSSNPNREATVTKEASDQILEPKTGIALCVFISKVPTPDDCVALVSARITAGDFYRDAVKEAPQQIEIKPNQHHFENAANCVVRIV